MITANEETIESINSVKVFQLSKNNKPYIQFDFKGYLDHPNAVKAIGEWKQCMEGTVKKNLIYNCVAMSGFDSTARKMWQSTMSELKQKIGSIWIISPNMFILAAAKTMGILAGFSIKVAKSIADIKD